MPKITGYYMPKITDYSMAWSGRQTIENTPAIAERLKHMLKGKRFTLATTNDGFLPETPSGFEVRTGLRIEAGTFECDAGEEKAEPYFPYAHLSFRYKPAGGYGYWGLETRAQDWMKDSAVQKAFTYPHWTFERDETQARVAYRVPSGALVVTIFAVEAVEEDNDEETSE